VVLVVLGIVVSMTTLSFPETDESDHLQREGERLVTLIKMARDEAIIRNEEWAIVLTETGYSFELQELTIVDNKAVVKRTPIDDKLFRTRPLERLKLSLLQERTRINLQEGDDKATIARIYILSSGEMTETELRLGLVSGEDYLRVNISALGEITLKDKDS